MGYKKLADDCVVVRRGPEVGRLAALWSAVAILALRDWVVYHPDSCGPTIGVRGARIGNYVQAWKDADLWLFDSACLEPSREACQAALPVTIGDLRAKARELLVVVDGLCGLRPHCGAKASERDRKAAWAKLMDRFRDDDFWACRGSEMAGKAEDGRETGLCACGEAVYAHGVCRRCYYEPRGVIKERAREGARDRSHRKQIRPSRAKGAES